jgi:hypothetical protein
MRGISRVAPLALMTCALAVGGSAIAVANGKGHRHHHATLADVTRDVKDANTDATDQTNDSFLAHQDLTTPDSPAGAQQEQADGQNEQADNESESQDITQEGDSASQTNACQGLLTDDVQYEEQTGTCSAETGHDDDRGDNSDNDQKNDGATGGQDNSTTGGQAGSPND